MTAASKVWGLGFGPVTAGRERAKRAPDLWLPPPNLKPQTLRASNGGRAGCLVRGTRHDGYQGQGFTTRVLGLGSLNNHMFNVFRV